MFLMPDRIHFVAFDSAFALDNTGGACHFCHIALEGSLACNPSSTRIRGWDGREAAALSEGLESSFPVGVLARIPPTLRGGAMFEKKVPLVRWTLHKKVPLVRWLVLFLYGRRNPSGQLHHKPGCACIHYLCQPGVQNRRAPGPLWGRKADHSL